MIKAINHRLEVTKKKQQKREEMMERRKIEAITARCKRARGGSSLSSKEEKNYENDIGDKTDLDQAGDDKNPLEL